MFIKKMKIIFVKSSDFDRSVIARSKILCSSWVGFFQEKYLWLKNLRN